MGYSDANEGMPKPMKMIMGGGSGDMGNSGPTGSPRMYPKSKGPNMTPDFNPRNDKKRGATEYAVGGV